jgi:hypothetical protein
LNWRKASSACQSLKCQSAEVQKALTHVLNALRIEMSSLIGDGGRAGVTEAVLLQYCDEAGRKMEVTARTRIDEPTHRPVPAYLFLASYVAKQGRWFAENDFLSNKNPFRPTRLTVPASPRVDYRSVLYLPITTAQSSVDRDVTNGPMRKVTDYCLGVICVHSQKSFRFWRWGDHNKDNGGGSGNVAYERAVPYIALATSVVS